MPFLAAPGGCGDSLVAEIHLFVHLHLILQAGQNELFSSVFLFPAAVLFHQRAGDSLAAVFRQDTETQQHDVFSLRVVQTDFIEKGITEFCLVCCKSVQRSGDFSGFFVYCRQKQLRRVLHPLAHALFGARLIRRKARQLNGNALFLADKAGDYQRLGLETVRLMFTTEKPEECVRVLERYQGRGRYKPGDLTRGLYYRDVE